MTFASPAGVLSRGCRDALRSLITVPEPTCSSPQGSGVKGHGVQAGSLTL